MRNIKRVLSLALALVMVLGMMVITTSAATFDDQDEITKVEDVEVLYALGIVGGDGTGNFDPDGNFTRAAAAKLLTLMLVKPEVADKLPAVTNFQDLDASTQWAAPYIGYCANLGYIVGVNAEGTLFNPKGVLTDIELGKLVLCALGYDPAKYTGANWSTAVSIDLINAGLVDAVTGTAITREDACEMILTAMKWSDSPATYNVVKGDKVVYTSTDLLQAYLYAEMLDGKVEVAEPQDTLLKTVYGVTYNSDDTDAFGRSISTYTNEKAKLDLAFANDEAIKVYEGRANKLADELKGYTVDGLKLAEAEKSTSNIVYVNGDDTFLAPNKTLADAIVALTGDDATVEIYADGKNITKIVVVEYTYAYVEEVVEADAKKDVKASITLSDGTKVETSGYEEGEWVKYADLGDEIAYLAKLDTVTGIMTGVATSDKATTYTIGGEKYQAAYDVELDPADLLGETKVYVLGNNGKIIAVDEVDGAKPEKITNYVQVIGSYVDVTTTTDKWDSSKETTTVNSVEVKGVLSDGTAGVWTLAVTTEKGVSSVKIAGEKVVINQTEDGALNNVNGFYTYKLDGTNIELVAEASTVVNQTKIEKGALSIDGTYLINSDTTFIMVDKDNKVITKTGKAALNDATYIVAGDADIFFKVVKDEDGKEVAKIATVVYALGTTYKDAEAEQDDKAIIYVDGAYSVAKVDDKLVYTYTGIKTDGTEITVTSDEVKAAGIYLYSAKNEIVAYDEALNEATVDAIVGTIVELDGVYAELASDVKTIVIGEAKWEVGAEIVYFTNKDGAISVIYVVG